MLGAGLNTYICFLFSLLCCQQKISDFHQGMGNEAVTPAIILLLLFLFPPQKRVLVQKRKSQLLGLTIFEGNLVLCRSGVHFHWGRRVLSFWKLLFFLWGLAPSTHSGSGDLVWPCPESAGRVFTTLVSIWILALLSVCPRIYAFSWLCVSWLQESASQQEDHFQEKLFQISVSPTGALNPALLIPIESSRSQREYIFTKQFKAHKDKQQIIFLQWILHQFQKGVILHIDLVGKNLPVLAWKLCICLVFSGLYIQPAVPLSFFFSSEDLVRCVLVDFTWAFVFRKVMAI